MAEHGKEVQGPCLKERRGTHNWTLVVAVQPMILVTLSWRRLTGLIRGVLWGRGEHHERSCSLKLAEHRALTRHEEKSRTEGQAHTSTQSQLLEVHTSVGVKRQAFRLPTAFDPLSKHAEPERRLSFAV